MSLSRQSLALLLTTQNKQEKIHQKNKINKLTYTKTLNLTSRPNTPVRTAHLCTYNCVKLCYTIQHWTVLIIFRLIIQKIITVQMSIAGEGTSVSVFRVSRVKTHLFRQSYSLELLPTMLPFLSVRSSQVKSSSNLMHISNVHANTTRQHSYRKEDHAMRPIYGCT